MTVEPGWLMVAVEGTIDRLCGRPLHSTPYDSDLTPEAAAIWESAWVEADVLLETRAADEARRWLAHHDEEAGA